MTANDLVQWYYIGCLTHIIFITIYGFFTAPGKDECRWDAMERECAEDGSSFVVCTLILYLTAFWWPITFFKMLLKTLRSFAK